MKLLVRLMLCLMISFSLVELPVMQAQAHAGLISTQTAMDQMGRTQGQQSVANFLDRSDIQEQLVKLGVDPQEATQRLASLSDHEVEKLATDIEQATAGGDITGILVVVLLVLGVIYLVRRV
jgi:hypothetical protein